MELPNFAEMDLTTAVIVGVVVLVVMFVFFRELICWYFKFSRIADLLEQTNAKLDNLNEALAAADVEEEVEEE